MKKRLYGPGLIVVLVSTGLLVGCGGHRETLSGSQRDATVEFTIHWPTSRAIPAETQKINVWVSGPGIPGLIWKSFSRPTSPQKGGTALITVPAGPQRLFGAAAFDKTNRCIAFGNANADLSPGEHKTLTIEMQPTPTTPETTGTEIKNPEDVGWQYGIQVIPDPDNPLQAMCVLTLGGNGTRGLTRDRFIIGQIVTSGVVASVSPSHFAGGETGPRKIDIAFVLDTTGSMGSEIAGVRDSVIQFVSILASLGHDIRLAAVEFGDEIRSVKGFTSDAVDFRSYVADLRAYGGGDDPEIGLDAVLFAHENLSWRSEAEKFIIVITDATAHQRGDGTLFSSVIAQEVINALRGKYTVHVVSSRDPNRSRSYQAGSPTDSYNAHSRGETQPYDMKNLAPALGGIWIELPSSGGVSLTDLGIAEAILNTYRFKFPRALWFNESHLSNVKVYVKKDENIWIRFGLGL